MNIQFLKTYANFIHLNLKKKISLKKKLKIKKILTRKGPGVKGLDQFLRITLGPKEEIKNVIKILSKYYLNEKFCNSKKDHK